MASTRSKSSNRLSLLREAAAQWCELDSEVRLQARRASGGGEWPIEVVDTALDNVLRDFDRALEQLPAPGVGLTALAVLPGNVVGPTIATAFCAAMAGATVMLKSSSRELCLAEIVANQFESLGPPLAGTLHAMRWTGGDADFEAKIFPLVSRVVAFGDDATIKDISRRAPRTTSVIGYGSAFSIGLVPAGADIVEAAGSAASDIALFDQRGCLSPQTLYVEGDEARAIVFAHALRLALERTGRFLPRAPAGEAEKAAVAEFIRRLLVRALPPKTHALETVIIGPHTAGIPEYVVGVEPWSRPVCAGFGRIAIVKPTINIEQAALAAGTLQDQLDTVGVAGAISPQTRTALAACGALRICKLGEMQRPPFGYRPKISDFTAPHDAESDGATRASAAASSKGARR